MTKYLKKRGKIPLLVFLIIISFIMFLLFSSFGTVNIKISDTFRILINKYDNSVIKNLIINARMPRVAGSFIIGSILAISGNVLQLIIQNPLADPYLIGLSSGASFGAVLYAALTLIYSFSIPFGMESFAFAFSLFSTFLVILISKRGKKIPVVSLILSGVIVSSLFNSFTTFFTVLYWRNLIHVNVWLMGSTASLDWNDFFILLSVLLILIIIIFMMSKYLNLLSMGEEMSVYSGINPDSVRLILLLVNILAVSFCVSKAGIIGFVGLVIPHIVRLITGPYSGITTFYNIFVGGIFLMFSDFLSRSLFAPTELPIGVITSFVGAPVFIFILKRSRKND